MAEILSPEIQELIQELELLAGVAQEERMQPVTNIAWMKRGDPVAVTQKAYIPAMRPYTGYVDAVSHTKDKHFINREIPREKKTLYSQESVEGKLTLYQQDIEIDTSLIDKPNLNAREQAEELRMLDKYNISVRAWTEKEMTETLDWELLLRNPKTVPIFLFEGLATNHSQWTRENTSFVHRQVADMRILLNSLGLSDYQIVVCAVSCPGFGGTELKDEKRSGVDDVSVRRYVDVARSILKIFDFQSPFVQLIGHSAGGWMLIKAAFEGLNIGSVAVAPSLTTEKGAVQFTFVKTLDKIGQFAKNYVSSDMIAPIENLIARLLAGTKGPQAKMHNIEKNKHPQAFLYKLVELARASKMETVQENVPDMMPEIIAGTTDSTVFMNDLRMWMTKFSFVVYDKVKESGLLPHIELEKTELEDKLNFANAIVPQLMQTNKFGHDALAVEEAVQRQICSSVRSQFLRAYEKFYNITGRDELLHKLEKLRDRMPPVRITNENVGERQTPMRLGAMVNMIEYACNMGLDYISLRPADVMRLYELTTVTAEPVHS